jgi:hypothetical protein
MQFRSPPPLPISFIRNALLKRLTPIRRLTPIEHLQRLRLTQDEYTYSRHHGTAYPEDGACAHMHSCASFQFFAGIPHTWNCTAPSVVKAPNATEESKVSHAFNRFPAD